MFNLSKVGLLDWLTDAARAHVHARFVRQKVWRLVALVNSHYRKLNAWITCAFKDGADCRHNRRRDTFAADLNDSIGKSVCIRYADRWPHRQVLAIAIDAEDDPAADRVCERRNNFRQVRWNFTFVVETDALSDLLCAEFLYIVESQLGYGLRPE